MANKDTFWRDRRVLITGCTGLVGSWTTRFLVEPRRPRRRPACDQVAGSELHRSGFDGRIDVVKGSVESERRIERVLAEYEIQTVFHLAAQTIVGVANRSPISTFKSNIEDVVRPGGGLAAAATTCR
ncbi:MAG: GDP-mannose 4,6-dehydratase [Gemmataceae bacterium]